MLFEVLSQQFVDGPNFEFFRIWRCVLNIFSVCQIRLNLSRSWANGLLRGRLSNNRPNLEDEVRFYETTPGFREFEVPDHFSTTAARLQVRQRGWELCATAKRFQNAFCSWSGAVLVLQPQQTARQLSIPFSNACQHLALDWQKLVTLTVPCRLGGRNSGG